MATNGRSFDEWLSLIDDRTGCWNWPGHRAKSGYGYSSGRGFAHREVLAHRESYQRHVGPIPAGYEIDHLCRNRACIRPDHLEAVTPLENRRRTRKSKCIRGHALTPETTYTTGSRRNCKECFKAHQRRYYWQKKQRLAT